MLTILLTLSQQTDFFGADLLCKSRILSNNIFQRHKFIPVMTLAKCNLQIAELSQNFVMTTIETLNEMFDEINIP